MKKSILMRLAALLLTGILCVGAFSGCQVFAEPEYLPGEYVEEDYYADVDEALLAAVSETAGGLNGPLGDVALTPVSDDDDYEQPDASPNVPGGSSGTPADGGSSDSGSSPGSSSGSITIGSPLPLHDIAVKSGSTNFVLRCTAPYGSTVTATINGKTYSLKATKTVKTGTYVAYSAKYTMPSATGTVDLGPVKYSITYGSKKSSISSSGSLFAVGADATLRVVVKNTSTTGFASSSMNSGYVTILKQGAVDSVTDYKGDMYKLATGMWVLASTVTPQTRNVAVNNPISSSSYTLGDRQEKMTLVGNSHPVYKYTQTADSLTLTLYRTTGVSGFNLADSSIFSDVDVKESNGHTVLTFTQKESGRLWGFLVEYSGGTTTIIFKRTPTRGSDEQPFANLTVAIDPGHGGNDRGAAGWGSTGSYEKDINWSTAQRLKSRLEGLGATVVLLRNGDNRVELTDRLAVAQQHRVDFLVSVHCNASATNSSAKGVEVYYNDTTTSRNFAYYVSHYIAEKGERTNRGHKRSCFVITLNTYCPSILVEQGFVTNKSEFADLNSEQGQKNTVEGIVSGINAMLK